MKQEETEVSEGQSQATQTFAPALPTPTPHHSDDEENPCYSLRPGSSPQVPSSGSHCGLWKGGPLCWAKGKVTFKPCCESLANTFPTLSPLHTPSVGNKDQRKAWSLTWGGALVTPADMEEPNLDILGCRQSWMLQERQGDGGSELAGRRGKHTTGSISQHQDTTAAADHCLTMTQALLTPDLPF